MKIFMTSLIMVSLFGSALGQGGKNTKLNLLISPYSPKGNNKSISVYSFDTATGESAFRSKVDDVNNASYMVVSPDNEFVYSVSESKEGEINAFSFNAETGKILFINKANSGGSGPAYVSTDKTRKFVFAANYGSGSVGAIPIKSDGSLGSDTQSIIHQPKSGNTGRQAGSHAHSAVLSPDNKFLMVPDLGTDRVNIYKVDLTKSSNPLTPSEPAFIEVKAGSGPRHFTFHPNSKYAYLIHEMQGFISAYDYKDGVLTEKQTITILSDGYSGRISGADIHISPDGKFLYGSSRGDADEIIIYTIKKDGSLEFAGRQSTLGKHPRNFVIDPTGNFLLVGNNQTNGVTVFRRDKKTGLLTPTNHNIEIVEPGCLKFVSK